MDQQARIEVLEEELRQRDERIQVLEDALGLNYTPPLVMCLTDKERKVLGAIIKKDIATKQMIMAAVYSDAHADGDVPDIKIVDVFVCKMRGKLKEFGIEIKTEWGIGYSMNAESRQKLKDLEDLTRSSIAH